MPDIVDSTMTSTMDRGPSRTEYETFQLAVWKHSNLPVGFGMVGSPSYN